ncbi:slit 3 protein-like protein [Leptotrombidium deliense]|uniref:Slit 3 protein-like protein n=1 Tax=Leptotrombidium deliense TaxID=299467 RepID=A0A443SF32_9ACAR|nr:slit 3 protein-like protein [Leptotrombidium deliense]
MKCTSLQLSLVVFAATVSLLRAVVYKAPEDCEWKAVGIGDEVAVKCKLRTVNGAFDNTNFSLISAEKTTSLTVICDDILFESYLMNGSFEHLTQLKELNIERCKIRELPVHTFIGLSQLNNLTIRTMNSDWGELSLQILPESFSRLKALQRVELSKNSITHLPERLFCNLRNLRFVNLSSNQFSEVVNIGFSTKNRDSGNDSCKLEALTHLDVSLNKIKVLTDRGFSLLSSLQVLSLRHNLISRAEESSLSALSRLSVLQLSNNQLVALPPRFFHSVQQSLTELHLQNNSITVLPPGLFNGLQQLVILDLSHNEITSNWIGVDTFSDLIRVNTIDLSFNRLTRIDSSTFRSQYHLQMLQLHHNEIESIADNAFASLYNLQNLVLSHNRLTRVDATSFAGLQALMSLMLDHNRIESIHIDTFRNATGLMEVNLSVNRLDTLPTAINALHSLRSLDLSYNLIANISNASYQGNDQLYGLNLEFNRIGNLSRGVFQDLPSLRILNLAKNKIRAIEQGTFDDVPDLHALRLDSNLIADINGLFSNLRDLLMLNISANKIAWFDYALIPIGLQWFDIHDNKVESLGNYFELESVLKLRTLDCSMNKIVEVDSGSLPDGIEIVFLNNNSISKIAPFAFMGKQNLTRVDLTNNRLQTLDINELRLSNVRLRKPLPEFSVSGNPYLCDCNMEWLQTINSLDATRQYPRIVDLEAVECQLLFNRETSLIALTKANSSNFLCKYKSHCFALCHCCEFDACDCEMVCPENCTCYYDQTWDTNIVDCAAKQYTHIPLRIPMDVSELYLDSNNITTLTSHTFVGRKNLRVLLLNNSNIHHINNRTFNGLQFLQILHLEYNKLTTLYGYEFESLQNLQELHLHHNRISVINNNTFVYLRSLQILHLENNAIAAFQIWALKYNSKLNAVYLSQNWWTCKCQFMEKFQDWVQVFANVVKDGSDVRCFYNRTT